MAEAVEAIYVTHMHSCAGSYNPGKKIFGH